MKDDRSAKILIVDDKPANLLALEAVLQSPDYLLVRATSGAEAINLVENETFAAILLDIQMPIMDGYETARRIKRLPHGKDVPIVFVTAVYREDEDIRMGYAAGGIDYFAKPLEPTVIKTKVRIYADLYKMTRQTEQHEQLLAALHKRQTAEATLDKLLQTVSEGVLIADSNGNITRTNDLAKSIWGGAQARPLHGVEDFTGFWVDSGESVHPDEWAMRRALKTGKVHMNEPIAIRCFDGKSKTILESASALTDEHENVIGAVVVLNVIPPKFLLDARR